jgi:hypothetical protein
MRKFDARQEGWSKVLLRLAASPPNGQHPANGHASVDFPSRHRVAQGATVLHGTATEPTANISRRPPALAAHEVEFSFPPAASWTNGRAARSFGYSAISPLAEPETNSTGRRAYWRQRLGNVPILKDTSP